MGAVRRWLFASSTASFCAAFGSGLSSIPRRFNRIGTPRRVAQGESGSGVADTR